MTTDATTINAIQWQRDGVYRAIDYSQYHDCIARSRSMLELVAPVWLSLGYGYKVSEAFARLITKAGKILADEEQLLATSRANWKGRGSAETAIRALKLMIGEMKSDKRGTKEPLCTETSSVSTSAVPWSGSTKTLSVS